jgi:hypothetical protein
MISIIEEITKRHFKRPEIPNSWELNTCLINYYGTAIDQNGKRTDNARVGDHKDFELGPVASISLGERAFFQFVLGSQKKENNILYEQWLEDCSLLIFGGINFKEKAFHRVQRVENKLKQKFNINVSNFEARRINLTFRYVPREHIIDYHQLPKNLQKDTFKYVEELGSHSEFFKKLI